MNRLVVGLIGALLCAPGAVFAQEAPPPAGIFPAVEAEKDEGIPVADPLVKEKCGVCHAADDKGNLTRISWVRTTPEGWSQAIKRMVRLNGATLSPQDARSIVKSLSSSHGLAPEEAKPVMYVAENRIIDEKLVPNDGVRDACTRCHSFGRGMSWRRSKTEWTLLQHLHTAMFAQAEVGFQGERQRGAPPPAPGTPPKQRPGDAALEYLSKAAALHSPEWGAWTARMKNPRIAGRWLISATMPGRGRYRGELVIEEGASPDEFKTTATLVSLRDGSTLKRTGTAVMYAGYSWRGSSRGSGSGESGPDNPANPLRETMWFAPDQSSAEGRWYWGEYQEFGFDVKLQRSSGAPILISAASENLKAGTRAAQLRIFGDNLPTPLAPADIDLGKGVTVTKVVTSTKGDVTLEVDVAADAVSGNRDVFLRGAVLVNAFAVYRQPDYLAVTPDWGLSRLGSDVHPKGYQQFEAVAFENGADGKPQTGDDVRIGVVPADWTMEEFITVFGDDDKDFVGRVGENGFFTPASDGPNPKRKFGRNNYGDVWVVATARGLKDKDGNALTGRSHLRVTVPTYIRWDQPEVSN